MATDFQIFLKPVGSECNLNCSYCYYLQKKDLYPGQSHLMNAEVLEKYIKQHIEASENEVIFFSWHGGEPLLAGIDFYRKAVEIQTFYKTGSKLILNGIQTNGTLINDEWCRFFSKNNFRVGISIDGPAGLHNIYRRNFAQVINGYSLLKNHGLKPEILCVVNDSNVKHPLSVYNFFRDLEAEYITFIPLVERSFISPGNVSTSSVKPEEFGNFLKKIFDFWIENDIGRIKVQIFEEALRAAFNQEHTLCIFRKECGRVPVVEHNGDFYSCDHYVNDEHRLGNIIDHQLEYLLGSPKQVLFGENKLITLPGYCLDCEVRSMCNGECPKNRFIMTPDGEPGLNYLCRGYKDFFNHCRPFVEAVAEVWKG